MRLFAALPLPQAALERLTSLRLRLSAPKDGLRWSSPEQWHVTIQFFGECTGEQATALQAALGGIDSQAAEISLSALGLFAAKGILFASVDLSASLTELQQVVQRSAEACGLRAESRPFRPHVTLARSKGKAGFLTLGRLGTPSLQPFGYALRWQATQLLLMQSDLTQQGAVYAEVAAYALSPREPESTGGVAP